MLEPGTVRASIALAAYAEPLLDGRRVIVFGDSSSGLADYLLERGARLVHVYDPDASRVAEAATRNTSRNISIAPLGDAGLAAREGAFDVGIVEDLPLTGPVHSVLKRLRRALSPRGVALIAAPNAEARPRLLERGTVIDGALDYYQLYDAAKSEFQHVRMLGQTPFVGFALVDFAAQDAPEPSLDTAFVPGGAEEPEWFIALATSSPLRLDEFAVVQLPLESVLRSRSEADAGVVRDRHAERQSRERLAALEAELYEVKAELRKARTRDPDTLRLAELRQELAQRDKWIAELEARSAVADARADEAAAELDELRAQMEDERLRAGAPVLALEEELSTSRAEVAQLQQQVAARDARIAALAATESEEESDDLAALEAQLRERGRALRGLERASRFTEQLARELLDSIDQLTEAGADREADLLAARWSILQLQGSADTAQLEAELARARAELQGQSVLLAQAGSRPDPNAS